jgi:ectoine hydroxylase-related dioxygenase (phytanoyl-CoA dioxygenase family)
MNLTAVLTPEQVEQYHRDGYLVVPDLLSAPEVEEFVQHNAELGSVQTTYGLQGHQQDDIYRQLAHHPAITGPVAQLIEGTPQIVQTMYLNKAAKGSAGTALHQDSHYIANEPNTLMACWIAMSDTDKENGGLCVVPGSHSGELKSVAKNEDAEHQQWETEHLMRDRDGKEWNQKLFSFKIQDLSHEDIEYLTVPAGAGVFFTGMTIHGSFANHAESRPRRAFAIHYVREGTWIYRDDLQRTVPVEPGN